MTRSWPKVNLVASRASRATAAMARRRPGHQVTTLSSCLEREATGLSHLNTALTLPLLFCPCQSLTEEKAWQGLATPVRGLVELPDLVHHRLFVVFQSDVVDFP